MTLDNIVKQSIAVPSVHPGVPSVVNFWKANNSATIRLNTDIAIASGFALQPHLTSQECSSTGVPTISYGYISPLSTTPPPTLSLVQLYAANNSAFLVDFAHPSRRRLILDGTGKLSSLTMFTPAY